MQRISATALIALCVSSLSACQTTDPSVWDEINARSAALQPGGEAPSPTNPAGSPPPIPGQSPVQQGAPGPVEAGFPTRVTEPLLPRNAAPAPAIAGLGFLAGRWVAINPNKTVNEEIWTPPRGNSVMGSFRQIRLDGDCSFVDLSQISAEGDDIVLRLRHLHGLLQVPEGSEDVSLFRLVSLEKDRVEFTGTTGAEGVVSMVYERRSETELIQSVGFAPETGQEAFVTSYRLDR